MSVVIATVSALFSGDVGGLGISRFRFQRQDATPPTVTDCNTAGAAVRAFIQAYSLYWPNNLVIAVQPVVDLNLEDTGLVQGSLTMSAIPSVFTGSATGSYAGGTGARVDWLTNSLHGRRLIQGSTRLVPMSSQAFTASGGVTSGFVTASNAAAATYLASNGGGAIEYIVWHRPPAHTFAGGAVGLITGARTQSTASGLRSRRS
jgi:hypothetical protein